MFRGEIPPLTESNKNKNGGAHYYIFYDMKTAQMDQLWLSLTTSLVTNDGIANAEIVICKKNFILNIFFFIVSLYI